MATTTPNLGLSKPKSSDKLIDSLAGFNGNADLLDSIIGKLSDLNTAQKDSLVAAINEALTSAGTAAGFGNPVATVDGNTGTPSVEVTASGPDTAKVFTFTFKNLKGAKGAKGDPGEKGDPGSAGSDGISPVVSVETISGGHRITITDAVGSQSFDVLDGASGSGSGDMTKAVYDPQGKAQDIFAYADAKYSKPSGGIPNADLASAVQASLSKADSALQSVPSTYRTASAQDTIDSGKQAKITASGILKGDGSGGVSAAAAGTDYSAPSVGVTATLTAAGWDAGAKTQTVSVAGVNASSNGSLRIAQSATDDQFTAWGAAQPRVTEQADGSITVKLAGTVPTIDIPVEVLIV